jgi:hypothetical protein
VNEAPDYLAPLVAWRVWHPVQYAGETRLSSIYHQAHWPVREPLKAVCGRWRPSFCERHAAPRRRCTCGIHAAPPKTAGHYFLTDDPELATAAVVVGRVSLWGVVVECERGWRASHAYPERLFVPTLGRVSDVAARIAGGLKAYGVPVEVLHASAGSGTRDEVVSMANTLAS